MKWWDTVSQPWRYVIIICMSLIISCAGVLWASYTGKAQDGGRGGAIATVIAFAILFLRPDYGMRIYEERKARIKPDLPQLEKLDQEVKALVTGLRINSIGQAHQNRALVIASIIGTLFVGFGDWLAQLLICKLH
jgi:hypothetical protein